MPLRIIPRKRIIMLNMILGVNRFSLLPTVSYRIEFLAHPIFARIGSVSIFIHFIPYTPKHRYAALICISLLVSLNF